MKKISLVQSLAAFVVMTGMVPASFAFDSAGGQNAENVRLEFLSARIESPQGELPVESARFKERVRVFGNGRVEATRCENELISSCVDKPVVFLSADVTGKIEQWIAGARGGSIDVKNDLCEAIPNSTYHYTADNGSVVLQQGATPCGGSMRNMSEEARELVRFLDGFRLTPSNP